MSPFRYFAHPHAPNLALLGHVSPVIVVHMVFALAAFAIGLGLKPNQPIDLMCEY